MQESYVLKVTSTMATFEGPSGSRNMDKDQWTGTTEHPPYLTPETLFWRKCQSEKKAVSTERQIWATSPQNQITDLTKISGTKKSYIAFIWKQTNHLLYVSENYVCNKPQYTLQTAGSVNPSRENRAGFSPLTPSRIQDELINWFSTYATLRDKEHPGWTVGNHNSNTNRI